jgi:hypothetical protein
MKHKFNFLQASKMLTCTILLTLAISCKKEEGFTGDNKLPETNNKIQGCYYGGAASNLGQVTRYSGSPYLDQINNEEYFYLVSIFGVTPNMLYLIDGNTPNAYATPNVSNPQLPDGTVLLGLSLIQSECGASASRTCSAVPIIMAHEFAHIVDFKYKTQLQGKHKELFADYLAGAYMFYRSIEFKTTFTEEAARSFYSKGDFAFNSPVHHGTPEQRLACLTKGYQMAVQYAQNNTFLDLNTIIQSAKSFVIKF